MNEQQALAPTEEQSSVIALPAAAHVLLVATAGTGKTYVLAERTAALLTKGEVGPGQVLVLSFTRAAVDAIRSRARGDPRLGGIVALTFDAFATQLLARVSASDEWMALPYDARIEAATTLLIESTSANQIATNYKHILVDEVQDLVHVRARFVEALLTTAGTGFTLLGDPAQAIYGYQEGKHLGAGEDPAPVFEWVRRKYPDTLVERRLTGSFRAQSRYARQVHAFSGRLADPMASASQVRKDLGTFLLTLPPVSTWDNARTMLTRPDGRSTAVLLRNNGQALLVSEELNRLGIPHEHRGLAQDRAAPKWLAECLDGFHTLKVGRSRFFDRLKSHRIEGLQASALWKSLKACDPGRTDDLDLRTVSQRLRAGALPEELYWRAPRSVVVSTVHRTKGLEFDRVVLALDPDGDRRDDNDGEEARILFVGITRARSELYRAPVPSTRNLRVSSVMAGRWVRVCFRGSANVVDAVEIRGTDVDAVVPPATCGPNQVDAKAAQAYIRTSVARGDEVELTRFAVADGLPRYALLHQGHNVGCTSAGFSELLKRQLATSGSKWPSRITGLRVQEIDSVVGDPLVGTLHALGCSGFWSRVRVEGLGQFISQTAEGGLDGI